jgi:signal transduction histidine kinase
MFYRGTEISKGSGLGLYLVKNAVENLGGKITLESEEKVGTTFSVNLPC